MTRQIKIHLLWPGLWLLLGMMSSAALLAEDEARLMVLGASALYEARQRDQSDFLLHLQAMVEANPDDYWTPTGGLAAIIDDRQGYFTLDAGVRLQLPMAMTPFAGVGLFMSDPDYVENCDAQTRTSDCDRNFVMGIYPELGMHLWVGKRMRLSAFGRYYVTNIRGTNQDNRVIGLNFAFR